MPVALRAAVRRAVTAVGPGVDSTLPGWRARLTRGLTVFLFHEITAAPSAFHRETGSYTSPEVFGRQLTWITSRFTVVEPPRLRQFGGTGDLPPNAALLTFDDSWAGTFRNGLPVLRERDLSAVCFVNMGTIEGDPDLAAVRTYEASRSSHVIGFERLPLLDLDAGNRVLARVRDRYGTDAAFRAFQGPTATADDLQLAAGEPGIWLASHLYHHWDLRRVSDDLYEHSLEQNAIKLNKYPNTLPALATPHGYSGEDGREPFSLAFRHRVQVTFTGTGNQNVRADQSVLDRLFFPPEPSSPRAWWYAAHRRRVLGARTS